MRTVSGLLFLAFSLFATPSVADELVATPQKAATLSLTYEQSDVPQIADKQPNVNVVLTVTEYTPSVDGAVMAYVEAKDHRSHIVATTTFSMFPNSAFKAGDNENTRRFILSINRWELIDTMKRTLTITVNLIPVVKGRSVDGAMMRFAPAEVHRNF